jgi:hypothetical protein
MEHMIPLLTWLTRGTGHKYPYIIRQRVQPYKFDVLPVLDLYCFIIYIGLGINL